MTFYSNKKNNNKNWIQRLIPLYQLVIGLIFGNSLVAIFQPPGWIIWGTVVILELLPIFNIKRKEFVILQRIRRGTLLAMILDAFRLGS
jgi:uncharacterized membrane protein YoaK (UPF0700 family)|uniref:Hypothetical chloroplast RF20 n=1 Tax=Chloroparvula sp. RCC999 TaxID=2565276 RepID=A0A4D6C2J7_9CHLO|nr:hypothetical chloroplast RF20 [Chloroparvula sp. RCC999]